MVFKRNNWRFYRNISMCFSIFGSCICCSQKAVIKYYSDNKKKKYNNIETLLVRTKIYSYFKEDISSINNAQEAFSLPGHSVVSANINYLLLDKMK